MFCHYVKLTIVRLIDWIWASMVALLEDIRCSNCKSHIHWILFGGQFYMPIKPDNWTPSNVFALEDIKRVERIYTYNFITQFVLVDLSSDRKEQCLGQNDFTIRAFHGMQFRGIQLPSWYWRNILVNKICISSRRGPSWVLSLSIILPNSISSDLTTIRQHTLSTSRLISEESTTRYD